MEDSYWNTSGIAPATLDTFFEEESNVAWTGYLSNDTKSSSSFQNKELLEDTSGLQKKLENTSSTSILDNISFSSDSSLLASHIGSKSRGVRALGDKIEAWKPPSVSIKWKHSENGSCNQCSAKDEEINLLRRKQEQSFSKHNVTLPPDMMIHNMILGISDNLINYKTLKDKIALLDTSLESFDSSTILGILIFLKKTLNKDLFFKELQNRPVASQVYLNYLKQRCENTEAVELLQSLGRIEEAAVLKYYLACMTRDSESRLKNLKQAYQANFQDSKVTFEAKLLKQHIDLLEHQIPIDKTDAKDQSNQILLSHPRATSLVDLPLLTTLYYCSMYHWDVSENQTKSPLFIRKYFSIPDKQFIWTAIRARAKVKHWPLPAELDNLMVPKGIVGTLTSLGGFSGGGKIVKNSVPIDRIVNVLANAGAPSNVLFAFLTLLDSNEEKLKLGLSFKCHGAVIEAYVNMKNCEALEMYLKEIPLGSPDYVKAEQALKNAKWKK